MDNDTETNRSRDAAIIAVLKKYNDHPTVKSAVNRYKTNTARINSSDSAVEMAKKEAGQYRLLQENEFAVLFKQIDQGVTVFKATGSLNHTTAEQQKALIQLAAAYNVIYTTNLRLALNLALKTWHPEGTQTEDMIQDANMGLATAVRRFDVDRGYAFSTYATNWINQAIKQGIKNNSRTIRIPVHVHDTLSKSFTATKELTEELGRKPTETEVALRVGIPEAKLAFYKQRDKAVAKSLHGPVKDKNGQEDKEFGDLLPDDGPTVEELVEKRLEARHLEKTIVESSLSPRKITILCLRSGVYIESYSGTMVPVRDGEMSYEDIMKKMPTTKGLTLDEVGIIFGLTRERIRQIEKDAIDTLTRENSTPLERPLDINNMVNTIFDQLETDKPLAVKELGLPSEEQASIGVALDELNKEINDQGLIAKLEGDHIILTGVAKLAPPTGSAIKGRGNFVRREGNSLIYENDKVILSDVGACILEGMGSLVQNGAASAQQKGVTKKFLQNYISERGLKASDFEKEFTRLRKALGGQMLRFQKDGATRYTIKKNLVKTT